MAGSAQSRDELVGAIMSFLHGQDLLSLAESRAELEREIDDAGPDALVALKARLADAAFHWGFYAKDPLAKRVHHVLADRLLQADSELSGVEHALAVCGKPVVILANHLSYSDANLIEILLHRSGAGELADRLTTLAGPKVFASRTRRFSSLCFGTIRTPQSAVVSSGDAVMHPREVAQAARQSIAAAQERLAMGDAVLVFGEGTRSRTRAMHPLLAGMTRYLDGASTWVLPMGIVGTEGLFPIGDDRLHPVRVVVRVGQSFEASALHGRCNGNRRLMTDAIGAAIAELLPPEYRGVYGAGR